MKILVTGGGGFLGGRIAERLLARGLEVRILGRSAQPEWVKRGVDIVQGDLANAEIVAQAVAGCEAVFHVAARAGVWGSWDDFFRPNVLGTRNVLAACRAAGVTRLVHTSTPSVVFTGEAFEGADESLPYGRDWLCHYAHTKAIAEQEVLAAHDPDGLRVTALRPHLIWGIGDPHLLPRVIDRARAGRLRIVGDGKNRVDITHVDNAADAHLLAFDALDTGKAGGKAYFLSQGEPVFLWDWINGLLRDLGQPEITKQISMKKARLVGSVMETVWRGLRLSGEPPMTRFVAVELAKSHWYSIAAARRDLGFEPAISTKDGVADYVADWKIRHP